MSAFRLNVKSNLKDSAVVLTQNADQSTADLHKFAHISVLPPLPSGAAWTRARSGSLAEASQQADAAVHMKQVTHLCLVVDVSGSMGSAVESKAADGSSENNGFSILDLVKHALKTVVHAMKQAGEKLSQEGGKSLDEDFVVSLVTFASDANVKFEHLYLSSSEAEKLDDADLIEKLRMPAIAEDGSDASAPARNSSGSSAVGRMLANALGGRLTGSQNNASAPANPNFPNGAPSSTAGSTTGEPDAEPDSRFNSALKKADKSIDQLRPTSATNMWAGMKLGYETIQRFTETVMTTENTNRCKVEVYSEMWVFTDGQPNQNPPKGHVLTMKDYIKEQSAENAFVNLNDVRVNTYGFGYNLNAKLLEELATVGGGNYSFIPDAGLVGTIFVHALGNLLSRCREVGGCGGRGKLVVQVASGGSTSVSAPQAPDFRVLGYCHAPHGAARVFDAPDSKRRSGASEAVAAERSVTQRSYQKELCRCSKPITVTRNGQKRSVVRFEIPVSGIITGQTRDFVVDLGAVGASAAMIESVKFVTASSDSETEVMWDASTAGQSGSVPFARQVVDADDQATPEPSTEPDSDEDAKKAGTDEAFNPPARSGSEPACSEANLHMLRAHRLRLETTAMLHRFLPTDGKKFGEESGSGGWYTCSSTKLDATALKERQDELERFIDAFDALYKRGSPVNDYDDESDDEDDSNLSISDGAEHVTQDEDSREGSPTNSNGLSGPAKAHRRLMRNIIKDLTGQVREALSTSDFWHKWGEFYVRSLVMAHRSQFRNNFKDFGVSMYGGTRAVKDAQDFVMVGSSIDKAPSFKATGMTLPFSVFQQQVDRINALFDSLPPPTASCRQAAISSGRTVTAVQSMAVYNNMYGGCWGGDSEVQMYDRAFSTKAVRDVRAGDVLRSGAAGLPMRVKCVVETFFPEMEKTATAGSAARENSDKVQFHHRAENKGIRVVQFLDSGLTITPWHPVLDKDGQWAFPAELASDQTSAVDASAANAKPAMAPSVFNFILERAADVEASNADAQAEDHTVTVNGVTTCTLGHGLNDGGRVIHHAYWGSMKSLEADLSAMKGWGAGHVRVSYVSPKTGESCCERNADGMVDKMVQF